MRAVEKVARRIPGDGQLGDHDDVGPGADTFIVGAADQLRIRRERADRGVQLCDVDLHEKRRFSRGGAENAERYLGLRPLRVSASPRDRFYIPSQERLLTKPNFLLRNTSPGLKHK